MRIALPGRGSVSRFFVRNPSVQFSFTVRCNRKVISLPASLSGKLHTLLADNPGSHARKGVRKTIHLARNRRIVRP